MRISGSSQAGSVAQGTAQNEQDAVLTSLQKQLQEAKKSLQDLASNKDLSAEMKMEKRKEIQQQIQDINRQIMQRKQELHKEKQQKNSDGLSTEKQTDDKAAKAGNTMETSDMQSIIQGDIAVKSAKESHGLKNELVHKADVLETESKLDAGRGRVSEGKEAAIAELRSKATVIDQKIGSTLSEVQDKKDETRSYQVVVDGRDEEEEKDKKTKDAEPGLYVDEYR